MTDTLNAFGIDDKTLEGQRIQLVEDLKEYCKDNPNNCENEQRGIRQLDPNNWNWKRSDMEVLGLMPENKIREACQRRLNRMELRNGQ